MGVGTSKEDAAARRHRRSLSLCRYLAEDREVIGDYSLMVAPLYEWCEKLRRRNNQTTGPVWSQFTNCAPRRSTDSISGTLAIKPWAVPFYDLSTPFLPMTTNCRSLCLAACSVPIEHFPPFICSSATAYLSSWLSQITSILL